MRRSTASHRTRSIRLTRFIVTLSTVACMTLVFLRAQPIHTAFALTTRSPAHLRSGSPSLPPVGHFTDTTDGTALSIQFIAQGDIPEGTFLFTDPTGTQILGQVPLVQQTDGSFAEQGFPNPSASIPVRVTLSDADAQQPGQPSPPSTISSTHPSVRITEQFEPHGLSAFFAIGSGSGSLTGTTFVPQSTGFQLIDGCQGTLDSCANLSSGTVPPAVNIYDNDILTDNWSNAYDNSAQNITAQYNKQQFTALLTAQVGQIGQVTNITTNAGSFALHTTSAGQDYFSVSQTYTLSLNGKTSTLQDTTYYLWDSGKWLFWFSQ